MCNHCCIGFCLGTTFSKEARGGGGAGYDGRRRGRRRNGDGDFGFGPAVDEPIGAASGGEEGGVVRREGGGGEERLRVRGNEGGREGRKENKFDCRFVSVDALDVCLEGEIVVYVCVG